MGKRNAVVPIDDDTPVPQPKTKNYGETKTYDPTFHGPISKRSCTDVICCLVFVLFLAGLGVISAIGFKRGNVATFIYPTDYLGQVCGVSEAVKNKPNLFFFDYLECLSETKPPKYDCTESIQVCVETCPIDDYVISIRYPDDQLDDMNDTDWENFICIYGVDPKAEVNKGSTIRSLLDLSKCANYYTTSENITGWCYPEFVSSNNWKVDDTTPNNRTITEEDRRNMYELLDFFPMYQGFDRRVERLLELWPSMVAGIMIAMFASLIYIVLMRWMAGIMVWSSIVLEYGLLVYGTYVCWNKWNTTKNESGSESEQAWFIAGIIASVILIIHTLILLFLFKRFRIAVVLIKEASRAVSSMICSLLWPVIPFSMQIAFLTFWCFNVIYIASIEEPPYQIVNATDSSDYTDGMGCDPSDTFDGTVECVLVGFNVVPDYVFWFQVYNLIALYWIINFISALGETTLAGAYAGYYWAFTKPDDIKSLPLLRSFWRCIRYHIGSIAFGSLVITIIKLIRVSLKFIQKKTNSANNVFTKFISTCCKCCFWCLEKFLRFLNRNAYIEIAVYGKSFCTSAKNAFFLLMRNIARVAVLNGISSFMLFVGKMAITIGVAIFGSVVFDNWVPIVFMALSAYVVTGSFFRVYSMAIDTLCLCFIDDLERHDGTPEKPYYMSPKLMKILGVKNKKKKKK